MLLLFFQPSLIPDTIYLHVTLLAACTVVSPSLMLLNSGAQSGDYLGYLIPISRE